MIGRMHWQPPFRRISIDGPSMLPTLAPGEWWVARRGRPVVGVVFLLRDPQVSQRWLVKRITHRQDGSWWVAGDNAAASRDSRDFGAVPTALIFGPLWWRYGSRQVPHVLD